MPYVKSYYRRSAGMAAGGATQAAARPLDVAIYDASSGLDLLRARGGVRVSDVQFTTGLPGGYLECALRLSGAAAWSVKVDTGQKVIVRRGTRIVWWGWVEDVERRSQGRLAQVDVQCLGPWQHLQQRLATSWEDGIETAEALKVLLAYYCDQVSPDYSQIEATQVLAAANDRDYIPVADVVVDVCRTGNSADQAMLFALWEPTMNHANLGSLTNLLSDPVLEQGTTYWTLSTGYDYQTSIYHSATHGVRYDAGETGEIRYTGRVAVVEGEPYVVDYWAYFSAHAGLEVYSRVDWYTAADTLISSVYSSHHASDGTAGWYQWLDTLTAPATAAEARPMIYAAAPSGSGKHIVVDDVQFYLAAVERPLDELPRAHLWALDLSDYDYVVYTARLAEPWTLRETTRELVNAVWVSYQGTYTALAQDTASQALYRRRDAVVNGGELDATSAAQLRDTHLARWSAPTEEPATLRATPGVILDKRGRAVDAALIRAGDRLKIMDGVRAGTVVLINATSYAGGVAQLTPEREAQIGTLLARSI